MQEAARYVMCSIVLGERWMLLCWGRCICWR